MITLKILVKVSIRFNAWRTRRDNDRGVARPFCVQVIAKGLRREAVSVMQNKARSRAILAEGIGTD